MYCPPQRPQWKKLKETQKQERHFSLRAPHFLLQNVRDSTQLWKGYGQRIKLNDCDNSRSALLKKRAHVIDVPPEAIKLIGKGRLDFHLIHSGFDPIKFLAE